MKESVTSFFQEAANHIGMWLGDFIQSPVFISILIGGAFIAVVFALLEEM